MKNLFKIFHLTWIALFCINIGYAQTTKVDKNAAKAAETNRIINSKNYVFKANYVMPLRGGGKALTDDYDVVVTKDKVVIYLPYFGRAFSAPIDASDGGIKLTTTNFDYKANLNKKGTWDILITPKDKNLRDAKDARQLRLSVSAGGYATLQVTCLNRDPISFNGDIREFKTEK